MTATWAPPRLRLGFFRIAGIGCPSWRDRSSSRFPPHGTTRRPGWTGHCDDIPAAADAPTLDELLAKITAMTLDLLPDNHPGVDPASVYLQITALREAEPAAV
jgi:hypothetical protein